MPLLDDGLPVPVTGAERYLRAVLDELRGLRGDLAANQPADQVREPEAVTSDPKRGKKR